MKQNADRVDEFSVGLMGRPEHVPGVDLHHYGMATLRGLEKSEHYLGAGLDLMSLN